MRFWAHKQLAAKLFHDTHILHTDQFKEVDREVVYTALHNVPRLFQIWACKQVMGVAGTNHKQSQYKRDHNPLCPSCDECSETCAHVLFCNEAGRVDTLLNTIQLMDDWLRQVGTYNGLRRCIVDYARGRGGLSMFEIALQKGARFQQMAAS